MQNLSVGPLGAGKLWDLQIRHEHAASNAYQYVLRSRLCLTRLNEYA